jgi:potassium uptake Trk family protein
LTLLATDSLLPDFWILGLAIAGSILLYPAGNMAYIDALFFASGACTQSGLNTIDVNVLNTYQQIVIFFLPMLTNPITINTFVVFLRLYWFEKRFQHIAKEAKRRRGTLSQSRSQMRSERDPEKEAKGVNGRAIVVMHGSTRANGTSGDSSKVDPDGIHNTKPDATGENGNGAPSGPSDSSSTADSEDHDPGLTSPTQIKFADRVMRSDTMKNEPLETPMQWTEQDHIAVLERQRNPEDKGVLRIPGPRDAERGMAPETVEETEAERTFSRRDSGANHGRRDSSQVPPDHVIRNARTMTDDQGPRGPHRAITIEVPDTPERVHVEEKARAAFHILDIFRLRKPRMFKGRKTHEHHRHSHHNLPFQRPRANSFSSFRMTNTRDRTDMTPYLSWQPTIGRNSAFVDLTEEQREELGGIEYRSLKSLALILVLYFWGFTILGFISLIPWIIHTEPWGSIVDADGQSRVWWGFFTATSAFNDLGFTLTPDSMISFQDAIWPLLLMSFLIIIGNTGFPVMLRWIIWVTSKYIPEGSGFWEELQFLLDHPRRCFTLLFPSQATWWLFWILVLLNGVDLIFFIILDVSLL